MKTTRFSLAALTLLLLLLAIPRARALTVLEGFQITDFPNSAAAAVTYTLDVGGNDFVGASSGSDADYFKVTVLPGRKVTGILTTGSASHALALPLYAGTYQFVVGNVLPGSEAWGFTFTVALAEDYSVDTTGQQLIVTDRSGNGDTLTVFQPLVGTVQFAAPGRTFSFNGGAFTTGNSSIISHGTSPTVVNAGAGNDTINVGTFASQLPGLIINGGTGDDTVNFTGDITFAAGTSLDVDLQNDDPSPGVDSVNVAAGANIIASGSGTITVKCSRSVALAAGASLEMESGVLTVEANQQATATAGDFIGVTVNGGKLQVFAAGLSVKGRGGNAAGGGQIGVQVSGGGQIVASIAVGGTVQVSGTGGAGGGQVNRGVTVVDASSLIEGLGVTVIGQGGGIAASDFNVGVAVLSGGRINGGAAFGGSVNVTGTGGQGGFFNQGVELGAASITKSGPSPFAVSAVAGAGTSVGLFMANGSTISASNGPMQIFSDSMSLDGTSGISAPHTLTLSPITAGTKIDLGGADDPVGVPKTLGLTDAELDRVQAGDKIVFSGNGPLTISSAISPALAQRLQLGGSSSRAAAPGVDVTLGGTLTLASPLDMPFTSGIVDTGYPQLRVAGDVDLGGVTLDLTGTTFAGVAGNVFTLVENDGSDAIGGTFAGLPEGAIFAWPGSPLLKARISYIGGSGNDVVLTLVNPLEVTNADSSGFGSLSDALAYAATLPGANTITFHPSLSGAYFGAVPYAVNDAGGVTLDASALPGGATFDGSQDSQLFTNASGSSLTLRRLTLTKGRSGSGGGGAISNSGTLTLEQCTLHDNQAFTGGAIFNEGTLTLSGCTLRNNVATSWGGAIDNVGTLTLTRCTLASNSATGASGGAIFHDEEASTLTLTHCTLAGNASQGSSGGAISADAPLALHYCLVAGNSGSAIFASSSLTNIQSHITSSAALLAPLGDYGGPTQTFALQPGHPARDAATTSTSTSDQRGFPIVGLRDIGAYEAGTITNYAAWNYETLPASALLAQRAPGFDFDGDGRLNVLEYATFTDPLTGTTGGALPSVTRNAAGTQVGITFPVRFDATDLLYEIERSYPGVGPWITIADANLRTLIYHAYVPGIGIEFPGGNQVTLLDNGIPGETKAFYRLKASVP